MNAQWAQTPASTVALTQMEATSAAVLEVSIERDKGRNKRSGGGIKRLGTV